jgi:hypothetical protein
MRPHREEDEKKMKMTRDEDGISKCFIFILLLKHKFGREEKRNICKKECKRGDGMITFVLFLFWL